MKKEIVHQIDLEMC